MSANAIQDWLIGDRDYNAGVALYEEHGSNSTLKRLFKTGRSAFNSSKLYRELCYLQTKYEEPFIQSISPNLDKLEKETKSKFGELAYLKSQIKHMKSPDEKKAACLKIVDEFADNLHPSFDKIDYFKKHGKFPVEEIKVEVKFTDPVMILKRIATLRTYISKANNGRLRKENVPAWEDEIQQLERSLNA